MNRGAPIPETMTLHVPFRIVRCGGRKEIVIPTSSTPARKSDGTMVKALARAFRWKRLFDNGVFISITKIAEDEKLSFTYISRVLRLSTLAPDIVEAIVDGDQPRSLMLAELLDGVPPDWTDQRSRWLNDGVKSPDFAK
jgi:hypothetical protein